MNQNSTDEIKPITESWLDRAIEKRQYLNECWLLYDLSCGNRLDRVHEAMAWLSTLKQGNKEVKKITEWLDTIRK